VGINHAPFRPQKRTALVPRSVRVDESEREMRPLIDSPQGVTLQKLPGGEAQKLFQAQDVIGAQEDGGGAATLIEAGKPSMALEFKAAIQRQALVPLFI
jgi:hypothetical protein